MAPPKIRIGVHAEQGARPYMEDCHYGNAVDGPPGCAVAGVFDGHAGRGVAEVVSRYIPEGLLASLNDKHPGMIPVDEIKRVFAQSDEVARRVHVANESGSTACVAVCAPGWIQVANVGDSRCVLRTASRVASLSEDHKPDRPSERARIEGRGGEITCAPGDVPRVSGALSLSRALGDWSFRPLVASSPEVTSLARDGSERYMLLATDGLFDVFDNEEACGLADALFARGAAPHVVARELTHAALRRGSGDNVTAMVVAL
jgi:protein phosphatase 1L